MPRRKGKREKAGVASEAKKKQQSATPVELCQAGTDLFVMLTFGFFPLVLGLGEYGYNNIMSTKALVWLLLTATWSVYLGSVFLWGKVRGLPFPVRFHWIQWVAVAFLAVNVVSAILSGHAKESFLRISSSNTNSVIIIGSYVAAFLGVSLFGIMRRKYIWALAISMSISGIISLLQIAGLNPLSLFPTGLSYYDKGGAYDGVFLGTMGNIDHLSAILCLAIPALVIYALRSQIAWDKLLLIPAAVSLYVLLSSDVDAGKVGLMGCIVVVLPVVFRGRNAAKIAGVCCFAAIALGLVVLYFWPGKDGFLWEASQVLHGKIEPSFGNDRVEIWIEAWKHIPEHLLIGNGPASGSWLLTTIQKVNEHYGRVAYVTNAHNVYIGYLLETGMLGLGSYFAILGSTYVSWIRQRMNDELVALGAGIVCYLIQDFFCLGMVAVAPLLWVGLGLLIQNDSVSYNVKHE